MAGETKDLLLESVKLCLEQTFSCDLIKRGCTIALKDLDWKGFEIDMVGYSTETKGLYIVEAKNVTWIDSNGIAAAIGEIVVDMAGLLSEEVLESIRQYAELGSRQIANVFFYIALPNFLNARTEKTIHKTGLDLIRTTHRMLSGWVGLLEVHDLNMPARVVEGLESKHTK